MSDSPSTRPARTSGSPGSADREARIEQFLLTGLDHYFAGQYERAINVWTRVVFLERRHDRARAYIERARGALAERQRRSEELLHHGVSAYNAGDVDGARDLLTRALEHGNEGADVFLDRLNRVGAVPSEIPTGISAPGRGVTSRASRVGGLRRYRWAIALCVAGAVAVGLVSGLGEWPSGRSGSVASPPQAVSPEPLPIVRPSDIALDRARSLRDDGRLRDALRSLEVIRTTDPLRADADALKADIQTDILVSAGMTGAFAEGRGDRP